MIVLRARISQCGEIVAKQSFRFGNVAALIKCVIGGREQMAGMGAVGVKCRRGRGQTVTAQKHKNTKTVGNKKKCYSYLLHCKQYEVLNI